jgi:hypothetical protein
MEDVGEVASSKVKVVTSDDGSGESDSFDASKDISLAHIRSSSVKIK